MELARERAEERRDRGVRVVEVMMLEGRDDFVRVID